MCDVSDYQDNREWAPRTAIVQPKRPTKVRVGMWMAFKMLFSGYIHPVEQLQAKKAYEEYNEPSVSDPEANLVEAPNGTRKPRVGNANWWAAYALLAHAQFHSPTFTRANELIVSAWIRKAMEADRVRRLDIAKVLPLATRMAFVPTETDAMAMKYDNAPAMRRAYKKRDTKYWSNWFGMRRGHYESGL